MLSVKCVHSKKSAKRQIPDAERLKLSCTPPWKKSVTLEKENSLILGVFPEDPCTNIEVV